MQIINWLWVGCNAFLLPLLFLCFVNSFGKARLFLSFEYFPACLLIASMNTFLSWLVRRSSKEDSPYRWWEKPIKRNVTVYQWLALFAVMLLFSLPPQLISAHLPWLWFWTGVLGLPSLALIYVFSVRHTFRNYPVPPDKPNWSQENVWPPPPMPNDAPSQKK